MKETNNLTQVEEFANRACHLYQQHGSPESAASALDKAAKVLEANSPEAALRLYQHAIEVVMVSNAPYIFPKALRIVDYSIYGFMLMVGN